MTALERMTDSEDAAQMGRGTRAIPAKKQAKFKNKSYKLVPVQVPSSNSEQPQIASASPVMTTADPPPNVPRTVFQQPSYGNSPPTTTTTTSSHRVQSFIPESASITTVNAQANSTPVPERDNDSLEQNPRSSAAQGIHVLAVTSTHTHNVDPTASTVSMPHVIHPGHKASQVSHHESTTRTIGVYGGHPNLVNSLQTQPLPQVPVPQTVTISSGSSVNSFLYFAYFVFCKA